ncbi:MAG: response regulator transcription factor [Chitinophagales bacterium]|nr:response regulator transcription factor [Chitinophagales bacterium]MDW8427343.1 response regulator transcription factor [Chitinophagales bacterium]
MSNHAKILIADDEPNVLDFLSYFLQREGFTTYTAKDGEETFRIVRSEKPDLLLLDVVMPNMDGFTVTEHLRRIAEFHSLLIVFLSARNDEESQLKAFQAGADDYISKPIVPRLLLCRIQALLRRKLAWGPLENRLVFDSLVIDREKRMVYAENVPIALARKEFDLLALLAGRPGKVFQRHEIMRIIWNGDQEISDRTIDVHIRNLRVKIGERRITTVKGVGYRFEG